MSDLFVDLVGEAPLMQGLVAGVVIASLNLVGALAVLVWRNPSKRALNAALGFAAGVMLAASFTSLILPGIERGGLVPVLVGIALGAVVLAKSDAWVPHVHYLITGRARQDSSHPVDPDTGEAGAPPEEAGAAVAPPHGGKPAESKATGVLATPRSKAAVYFIIAITLHNMPEGLAVGVGFGSGDIPNAAALMLGIGIQNIPEGLAVAVAAYNAGLGRVRYAALTGVRAGLVEIPLVLLGVVAISLMAPLLPYAMGFAAGGMIYVICDEIIPETNTGGGERLATMGTMVGVIVMLGLDVALAA